MLGRAFSRVTWIFLHPSINEPPPPLLFLSPLTHYPSRTYLGVRAKWHWLLHCSLKGLLCPFFLLLAAWECQLLSSLSHTHTQPARKSTYQHMLPCNFFLLYTLIAGFRVGTIVMQVALPLIQWLLGSWVVLSECLKTFCTLPLHFFPSCWDVVFVLVWNWCCISWGPVSLGWVVFVWPFKGSPPVARNKEVN